MIDKRNFHLFQPLLYQVATGSLDASDIATPLREILTGSGVKVLMECVHKIDVSTNTVTTDEGLGYDFDYLILAAGSDHSYFGYRSWEPLAPGLKTLEGAFDIHARVFGGPKKEEQESDSAPNRLRCG